MFGLRILCLALGYLFGCFQTAYILGRMKGIDIREYGSGNAGTTNAIRVLGTKAGLLVFAGDMLKCLIALLLVGALFGKSHPEAVYLLKSWAFMGVVLGHDFPFYMNFKGGKGVAVMAGLRSCHGRICVRLSLELHPQFHPAVLCPLSDHKVCVSGIPHGLRRHIYPDDHRGSDGRFRSCQPG